MTDTLGRWVIFVDVTTGGRGRGRDGLFLWTLLGGKGEGEGGKGI